MKVLQQLVQELRSGEIELSAVRLEQMNLNLS